jgi:hypothetical protein
MKRVLGRSLIKRALMATTLGVSALLMAPQAASAATYPLGVVSRDYRFYGVPSRLPAGTYNMTHYNVGSEPHVFIAVNLGPVCSDTITTIAQADAFLDEVHGPGDLAAACPGSSIAGSVFAPPGGRSTSELNLASGRVLYFCPIPNDHGVPHDELGMIGFINVFSISL